MAMLPASAASASGLADPVDQWLPSADGASWVYAWSNSAYAPVRTRERYTVLGRERPTFRLHWTTDGLDNPPETAPSAGVIDYKHSDVGLLNLEWASTAPPAQFPTLCASAANCQNSLAGTHHMLIWGNRSPVLMEPLVRGTRWSALGGADGDVSSASRYLGRERVRVAAFPSGVTAAKVESEITQAGALGDPFGSGIRTTWWVRGVGPVKISLRHAGGQTSQAELMTTNLAPRRAPSEANYLPLNRGERLRFRWRNSKHMLRWSHQQFTVDEVVNNTARLAVKDLSGPIRVRGSYVLASRLSGVTTLSAFTRAASRVTFPALGPRSQPRDRRRRFFTPLDLMSFGFNPVLPAHPTAGQGWKSSRASRDYKAFAVTGSSQVVGLRPVRTPAGRFRALAVASTLTQKGFSFGSGRRMSYFAPGKGLVQLSFRHRDGSVSTVERLP